MQSRQLRVYLGCAVYDRNRILILPDVHCEGIVSISEVQNFTPNVDAGSTAPIKATINGLSEYTNGEEATFYHGRVDRMDTTTGGWRTVTENMGHLVSIGSNIHCRDLKNQI